MLAIVATSTRNNAYHDRFYIFVQLMPNKNDHFANRFTLMPLKTYQPM